MLRFEDSGIEQITFDDVLICPKYSEVNSRKDVDLSVNLGGIQLDLPIISANMDTVTEINMCNKLADLGAIGCLHRFMSINANVSMFKAAKRAIVSIGTSDDEYKRALDLYDAGARFFCIDLANGACPLSAKQTIRLLKFENVTVIVGNFATGDQIIDFLRKGCNLDYIPNNLVFKVGLGPGSVCSTRSKTGVGYPQLSAIANCYKRLFNAIISNPKYSYSADYPLVIADGGIKTPSDIAKALAAGASAVMIGGMFAGTYETPGLVYDDSNSTKYQPPQYGSNLEKRNLFKKYRGSASKESYEVQNKHANYMTDEGVSTLVPFKGPVENIIIDIAGGLRSSFSYVNATNLKEFKSNASFIRISNATKIENKTLKDLS